MPLLLWFDRSESREGRRRSTQHAAGAVPPGRKAFSCADENIDRRVECEATRRPPDLSAVTRRESSGDKVGLQGRCDPHTFW